MKKTILLFLLFFNITYFTQNKEWINLTNGDMVTSILEGGNNILWIGTDGGLVKFNKETEEIIHYNRANANLPGNHIRAMATDSSGSLWIGTQYSGVGKFDGNTWQTFNTLNSNLPHNQWNISINLDAKGNIYFGSLWFFSKYDGNIWRIFKTGNPVLSNLAIHDIKFDKNDIGWIGASWGLGKFENGNLTEKFNNFTQPILTVEIDSDNNIWLGTDGNGIYKFNGQNFTVFDTTNSEIPDNIIYDMEFDKEGNLWISTASGIAVYKDNSWQIYNSGNSNLPKNDFVMCIKIDKNNIKWFGTKQNGLYKFDNKNWKRFDLSNSIITNYIYDIAVDKKNNIYLGGYDKGLCFYDRNNWHSYKKIPIQNNELDLNSKSIHLIYFDKGENLYVRLFCTTPWLIKYNGMNWKSFDSSNTPFSNLLVNSIIHENENNMWLGTDNGLIKYNGTDWIIFNKENTPLRTNWISDILFDKEGNLWVGLMSSSKIDPNGGLAKYDGSNWVIYDTSNSLIPYNDVSVLILDSNYNFWLSCSLTGIDDGFGLTKFDGENFVTYNTENSEITSNKINDITLDADGNLWLAAGGCMDCRNKGGLIKYDGNNNWVFYNQQNSGITIDDQTTVAIDSFDNKWIGHIFSGVSVFREDGVILSSIKNNKTNKIFHTFQLLQNYPNPFNPNTTINYTIPAANGSPTGMKQSNEVTSRNSFSRNDADRVTLKVYDVLGREIKTLVNKKQKSGNYKVEFNAGNLPSGIYFYRLSTSSFAETKKMVLLK